MGLMQAKQDLATAVAAGKPKGGGGGKRKSAGDAGAVVEASRRSLRQAGVECARCILSTCDLPEDEVGSVPATAAVLQQKLGLTPAAALQLAKLSSAHRAATRPGIEWDPNWKYINTANPQDYHNANRAQVLFRPSEGSMRRIIRGVRNSAKMTSLIMVLKEAGHEDMAKEAEAALAVLLDPPPPQQQPTLTAFEEARAARIAGNEARMSSILSGLRQAENNLADSKKNLVPAKHSPSPEREFSVDAILEHRDVGSGKAQ
ncbi:hypothetical protein FOA52_008448 [Chlamydomonas sp. UWO 241]|nr:hypothetical protein FOA52_008448 [Chlamydomonas sp. UWO 241]